MATYLGRFVITMPTVPAPKSIEPAYIVSVGASTNPFNQKQQIYDWDSSYSEIRVTMPPMTQSDGLIWAAFVKSCKGMANVFTLPTSFTDNLPAGIAPNGYWSLKSNTVKWSVNDGKTFGLEFELREAT